jgi:hypothetical protein
MTPWQTTLRQIRDVQVQLARLKPYRDFSLAPNPKASPQAIAAAEARLGHELPPSYRAFLAEHDGWTRFYDGASLLGCANLGRRLYEDLAWAAYEASYSPSCHAPPTWRGGRPPAFVPFGVDLQATTLFAFDPTDRAPDGELAVVAWIHEIGLRKQNFAALLETVLELCQAEMEETELLHARSA